MEHVRDFLDGFSARDIFWHNHHAEDFIATRRQYVLVRLRFMLLIFVVMGGLWILADFFILTLEHFQTMVLARICFVGSLLLIWRLSMRGEGVKNAQSLLTAAMLATMIFYAAACQIIASGVPEAPPEGYIAIPVMALAMLGFFPVSLLYTILVIGMVAGIYMGLQWSMDSFWTQTNLDYLWTMAMMAGVVLLIQAGQLLMLLRLYQESTRDPLTGLINRRVLMKQLMAEVSMHEQTDRRFSLLMFDLDNFKRVNDTHGHMVGDKVLQNAAKLMAGELRSSDIIARFGGEEFVAVLPGRGTEDAILVAERIQQLFESRPVYTTVAGEAISITTSIGVTEYATGEKIEGTLNRVDDLLYDAKESGRNRLVASQVGQT